MRRGQNGTLEGKAAGQLGAQRAARGARQISVVARAAYRKRELLQSALWLAVVAWVLVAAAVNPEELALGLGAVLVVVGVGLAQRRMRGVLASVRDWLRQANWALLQLLAGRGEPGNDCNKLRRQAGAGAVGDSQLEDELLARGRALGSGNDSADSVEEHVFAWNTGGLRADLGLVRKGWDELDAEAQSARRASQRKR